MLNVNVALAEWLRRVPAKYMGFPRESSNLSGDVSETFLQYITQQIHEIMFFLNITSSDIALHYMGFPQHYTTGLRNSVDYSSYYIPGLRTLEIILGTLNVGSIDIQSFCTLIPIQTRVLSRCNNL